MPTPRVTIEASRALVERAKATANDRGQKLAEGQLGAIDRGQKLGHRPPVLAVPLDEVAQYLGVPRRSLRRALKHVAAVDEFPDMARYSQKQAIRSAAQRQWMRAEEARVKAARAKLRAERRAAAELIVYGPNPDVPPTLRRVK